MQKTKEVSLNGYLYKIIQTPMPNSKDLLHEVDIYQVDPLVGNHQYISTIVKVESRASN